MIFSPPRSTFEPTKRSANVDSINIIPGEDTFFFDIRLLPCYKPDELVKTVNEAARAMETDTGAKIDVTIIHIDASSPASSPEGDGARALSSSIKDVLDIEPMSRGIGGQTCANCFRAEGMEHMSGRHLMRSLIPLMNMWKLIIWSMIQRFTLLH